MSVQRIRAAEIEVDPSIQGLMVDIDRFASHDGPGIRTVVYLKGCPLRCLWCHSPETQSSHPELLYQDERCTGCWLCLEVCPERALTRGQERDVAGLDRARCTNCGRCVEVCYPGALKLAGTSVSAGELVDDVAKDLTFFQNSGGGVTLSGGEPARQPEFSYNFLLGCRRRGIHTALETTGHARWEVMSALASVADLLLYDVKLTDDGSHRRYTGVSNRLILENLGKLAVLGHDIQVRVPCIPGINDGEEQARSTARLVRRLGVTKIALLPYNTAAGAKYQWLGRSFTLPDRGQTGKYMASLAGICRAQGLAVQVGG